MRIINTSILAAAVAFVIAGVTPCSAVLLSNNNTGGDYPGSVVKLSTGATYTWGTDALAGNGPGNTDSQTLAQDASFTKMTDGISAAGGGSYATYSAWDSSQGQTAIFNLNSVYRIEYVTLSASFNATGNTAGVGLFQAYTSTDGVNYTLFGRWTDAAPSNGSNQILTINPAADVNARYVMFYTNRYAGNAGESTLPGQTYYHQVVLGEMAVWGTVPEPKTWGLIIAGLAFIAIIKRRKAA